MLLENFFPSEILAKSSPQKGVPVRELWVELDEFPNYSVSNMGEVVNIKTGTPIKPSRNQNNVPKVTLQKQRIATTISLAVLVATTFVPGKIDYYDTPIHLDGNRSNCRADNLVWRPRWYAIKYHRQFMMDDFYRSSMRVQDVETGLIFDTPREAALYFGAYYLDIVMGAVSGDEIALLRRKFIQIT